jgi:hypothetical protein
VLTAGSSLYRPPTQKSGTDSPTIPFGVPVVELGLDRTPKRSTKTHHAVCLAQNQQNRVHRRPPWLL